MRTDGGQHEVVGKAKHLKVLWCEIRKLSNL